MNILIPDSWLREYLETTATPETIAKEVSLCGPSVERIEIIENEPVYDVEITTNRVDSACVRGFAREAAVILQAAGIGAKFLPNGQEKSLTLDQFVASNSLPLPKISCQTPKVERILTVVLDQVQDITTPSLIAKRLRQIGEHVHSSVIDITNYITHELGHPCHAFDYDKIMNLGGEIVIKQAEKGKNFITLDGEEHETFGGEIVFESKSGEIIDLPAIKGMKNTAIDTETKRVLFWLENMEAKVVRQASMNHAIRTVAAILNEKNVDPNLASEVMARGIQLFEKVCQAQLASNIQDKWTEKPIVSAIKLSLKRVDDYLGVRLDKEKVIDILQSLGFLIKEVDQENLLVTPPSFRLVDVTQQADVIEEVARIYGYSRLKGNLNFPVVTIPKQKQYDFALEEKMLHFLAGKGLSEVYTYSMVSSLLSAAEETTVLEEKLKINNPLNDDLVYLRQKLYPSLEQVYQDNFGKTKQIKGIFELAKVYFPEETTAKIREELHLAVLSEKPYREVKAWLDQLLHLAFLKEIKVTENGEIFSVTETKLGEIKVLADGKTSVFELNLEKISLQANKYPHYQVINNQPIIIEDLTFKIANQAVGPLIEKMKKIDPLIKKVTLKDIYQQNYTFTYQYQREIGALSSEDVAPVRKKIVETMNDAGHQLVGKI